MLKSALPRARKRNLFGGQKGSLTRLANWILLVQLGKMAKDKSR
jgi:hypothetical protein